MIIKDKIPLQLDVVQLYGDEGVCQERDTRIRPFKVIQITLDFNFKSFAVVKLIEEFCREIFFLF
jgi:hypothetical protein